MTNQFALQQDLEHLVFDTIEHAHLVDTPEQLNALFNPACQSLGFDHIGTFSVRDPDGRMIGNYHAGTADPLWTDHYIQQHHFENDSIVRMLPHTLEAMVWREVQKRKRLSANEARLFHEAGEFGLADGYVLPQHYTNGAVAATILTAQEAINPNPRRRAATHILSAYFAMAVRRLMAPSETRPSVRLSPRQRECLQWVRAGKSDWEIGEILNISEHTVREHIEAARRKLGVRTRTQAVIEAIAQRLISI
jgi:DNA-binding CsgD family transcriptional regulator